MKAVLLLAAIACAGAPSWALAQDTQIGSRVQPRQLAGNPSADGRAVMVAHYMVGCAVVQFPEWAKRYMSATTPQAMATARTRMFGSELSCGSLPGVADLATDVRMQQPTDVERGMVAEALLSHLHPFPVLAPEPLKPAYRAPWSAVSGRAQVIDEMAACVVAVNPVGVSALLQTSPEAEQEARAFSALAPDLGRCLVKNARLTANRQGLRAALAEALYHRITDPTNTVPSTPQQTGASVPVSQVISSH